MHVRCNFDAMSRANGGERARLCQDRQSQLDVAEDTVCADGTCVSWLLCLWTCASSCLSQDERACARGVGQAKLSELHHSA